MSDVFPVLCFFSFLQAVCVFLFFIPVYVYYLFWLYVFPFSLFQVVCVFLFFISVYVSFLFFRSVVFLTFSPAPCSMQMRLTSGARILLNIMSAIHYRTIIWQTHTHTPLLTYKHTHRHPLTLTHTHTHTDIH